MISGVGPSSTFGGWFGGASEQIARLRGQGDVGKLEIFVFLQLESCNLVNTFRRKLRAAGDEYSCIVLWAWLTKILWEIFDKILLESLKISHF